MERKAKKDRKNNDHPLEKMLTKTISVITCDGKTLVGS
jgi:hypothetical protein